MKLTKSIEDYLEAIYILSLKEKDIRMKDIAEFASVKLPSATEAINKLIKNGYVEHSPYGDVTLTK
ncbi:MAG: MarR family transcriptional regulator, partial [Caldisericaceae bacterium]|nr:MarR family transcriptional regulator [Caldisericaceae bacterium]